MENRRTLGTLPFLGFAVIYVLDRLYFDKKLLGQIVAAGADYLVRLQDRTVYEVIEERPLSAAQKKAGVLHERIVRIEGLEHAARLIIAKADVHLKRVKRKPGLYVPSSGRVPNTSKISEVAARPATSSEFSPVPQIADAVVYADIAAKV